MFAHPDRQGEGWHRHSTPQSTELPKSTNTDILCNTASTLQTWITLSITFLHQLNDFTATCASLSSCLSHSQSKFCPFCCINLAAFQTQDSWVSSTSMWHLNKDSDQVGPQAVQHTSAKLSKSVITKSWNLLLSSYYHKANIIHNKNPTLIGWRCGLCL